MSDKLENTEVNKNNSTHINDTWDDPEGLTTMEGFFTEYNRDIAVPKEGAK